MRKVKRLRFYVLLFCAALLTVLAFMGPILAPVDPNRLNLQRTMEPPGRQNIFGTDYLGRDLFSRVLHGARNSFGLTLSMVVIVACIGTFIGMAAGFAGGIIDSAVMQIADVLLAFPAVVFAMAISGIWGPDIYRVLAAIAIVSWAKYARIARELILDIRRKEYVTQAVFAGSSRFHILVRYLLPNLLPNIILVTTSDIGEMMITLSALSFLGMVSSPYVPEWGSMLAENRAYLMTYPYMILFPGLALLVCVIAFNLLGDSLRDVLDPRAK